MRTRYLVPVAGLVLVVTVAAPAHAVPTITYDPDGHGYYYGGDSASLSAIIGCNAGSVVPISTPSAPCAEVESMTVSPMAGTDLVNLIGVNAANFPNLSEVSTYTDDDSEEDTVVGSPLRDYVVADFEDVVMTGAGHDRIEGGGRIEAGDGNDVIVDASAEQGAFGGPGDDRFVDSLSSGGTDGGPGDDSLEADFHASTTGIDFTLSFTASQLMLDIPSTPGVDATYFMTSIEHLFITLLETGTQTLNASAFPGNVHVRGFGGADTLIGSKRDDILRGGSGNDVIEARDGVVDIVDCGAGSDIARVDGIDRLTGCESITYAKPNTSGITGPGKVRKGRTGTYKFSSSVPGSAFQCKVDAKPWRACASPYTLGTGKLSLGQHTLRVRAGYPTGNWDLTPSRRTFKVVR